MILTVTFMTRKIFSIHVLPRNVLQDAYSTKLSIPVTMYKSTKMTIPKNVYKHRTKIKTSMSTPFSTLQYFNLHVHVFK